MEHTFLEFGRILRVIIHNICHLWQRVFKHPFNVYLMLLIQCSIREDVRSDGAVFVQAGLGATAATRLTSGFITAVETCLALHVVFRDTQREMDFCFCFFYVARCNVELSSVAV